MGILNPMKAWGVLPYKSQMEMCHWMGSHFHDWSDYNEVAFSIVTRMGSQILGFLGKQGFKIDWLKRSESYCLLNLRISSH